MNPYFIKLKIFLLLTLMGFSSYALSNEADIDTLFSIETQAKLEKLKYRSNQIVSPIVQFLADNNKIIITALFSEDTFYIYPTTAPYEPNSITLHSDNNSEIVYAMSVTAVDSSLYFLTRDKRYCILSNIDSPTPFYTTLSQFRREDPYLSISKGSNDYIVTGLFTGNDAQFALLNNDFYVTHYFGSYPKSPTINHPIADLAFGLQGVVTHSTQQKSFLYTSNMGAVLMFFSFKNDTYEKTNEYLFHYPSFQNLDLNGHIIVYDKETINGAISITANKNSYYVLYSNQNIKGGTGRNSDTIYVFDTKGTPVKKIKLNRPVAFIAYDNISDRMFAIEQNNTKYFLYEILLNN